MVIKQGDIYWVQARSDIVHPHVVIQENALNHTVVVCALTSNLKRVNFPGNILLDEGEAHLPHQSVIEVSKASTVDISQLGDYIGSLSERRIEQILASMRFLQFFHR
jgi:mRNA interferase MazF